MKKTALQEFLEQIVLKQVNGSIYLLPAITDVQINEALEKEKQQIRDAYMSAVCNVYNLEVCPIDEQEASEDFFHETYEAKLF